jgi:hypothetical protein
MTNEKTFAPPWDNVLPETKEEVRKELLAQLEHFGNSDIVHLFWKGYLAGIYDLGMLLPDDCHELNAQLKDMGEEERRAIFVGYPGQYE